MGETEIEIIENVAGDDGDAQRISKGPIQNSGGNCFCELLLR
jgi:hypothetical protein